MLPPTQLLSFGVLQLSAFVHNPYSPPRVDARPCSEGNAVLCLSSSASGRAQAKTVPQTNTSTRRGMIQRELSFRDGCSISGGHAKKEGVTQCFSTEGPRVEQILFFYVVQLLIFKKFSQHVCFQIGVRNMTKKLVFFLKIFQIFFLNL